MSSQSPPADPVSVCFPLTSLQQGMLFHWLSDRHSGTDVEQLVIDLPEPLDFRRWEAAWQKLTARHPVLRTAFRWDGEVEQVVSESVRVPVEAVDQSGIPELEQRSAFAAWLHQDRMRGFCLEAPPLQRVTAFRLGTTASRIVWTFHHAILDGRSFPVLLEEVFSIYEGLPEEALRAEPAGFQRHVEALQKLDFTASESWWKEKLRGFGAPLPLVVNRVGQCGAAPRQADVELALSEELTAGLRQLAEQCGVTMNTLFQAAWGVLLSRYTGETDVIFGAVRACRKSTVPGVENSAGLFINTLPVRCHAEPEKPLDEFLRELRDYWVEMRPHEHTPLALVQAWSGAAGEAPLFQTAVNYDGHDLCEELARRSDAWKNRRVRLYEKPGIPLVLVVHGGQTVRLLLEYDNLQFAPDAMERMLRHLEMLLSGMVKDPGSRLRDLEMVTAAERDLLVHEWNPPAAVAPPAELTLHEMFSCQAARTPDAIALTGGEISMTYAELESRSDAVAAHLRRRGVGPETIVGLCLERCPDLVVALLGILKAGGAYLPIDLAYPSERLSFMLQDARAPVFLTQRRLAGRLPGNAAEVVCMEDIPDLPAGSGFTTPPQSPDQLCYVLYTSGSTGKPKGCCITHRNITRLFSATDHWFHFNSADVWTLFHSTAFDFSVWEIWGALLHGGRLVVVPYLASRSPEEFCRLLSLENVTVLNQTPSAFRQLMAAEESAPQHLKLALRLVIFGGEALEMQSLKPWFDRHGDQTPQLVNMYGITETTVHVTWRPLSKEDLNSGSVIGVPIPDLQVYILDAALRPVPIGVPGELFVGGAGLARGYWQRPELTAERFIPDHLSGTLGGRLYRTGDLARFLPSRDIEYLGRIDHQVKIRGFRIELGEIESVLCSHPQIRESAVLPREDVPGEKRLCAYLVCAGERPAVEVLRSHLKEKLPDYMIPAAFVFLDKFPITNNGKLDRKSLPPPQAGRESLAKAWVAPRNELEALLADVWASVLKVDRVGVQDNFFELGGDSILSIHMIARARKAGVRLTPRQLFDHQTVAALAAAIAAEAPVDSSPAAVTVNSSDIPLQPIQHWFFEQDLRGANYWNQAFLFVVSERLDHGQLRTAVQALLDQHESLRLRFRHDGRWIQSLAPQSADAVLEVQTFPGLANGALGGRIREIIDSAHRSLDFQNGPLVKFVYLDVGEDRPGRLFIAAHHLAVDGVSWSILLHDLESACQQAAAQVPVQLPPVPAPFSAAAGAPARWLASAAAQTEIGYWRKVRAAWDETPALPPDAVNGLPNTEESVETVSVSLTAEETSALLQMVPRAYKTRIGEVLLAALALGLQRTTGRHSLCLNVEGHGREEIFENLDLSRTVGWFTAIYPILLELPSADAAAALKSVKETMRAVPQHGAGFGVLKYLGRDLAGDCPADVLFNYLGRLDQITDGSDLFLLAPESTQPWHCPEAPRRYAIEIDSWVLNECFSATWRFSRNLHRPETVRRAAGAFIDGLRDIILHCQGAGAGGFTPADFPAARIDQASLDQLCRLTGGVADIFALSPTQQLFYTAAATKPNAGYDQWHCRIRGQLDVAAYQDAWREVFRRHPILRASYHSTGLAHPVQVVHETAEPSWAVEDWRSLPSDEAAHRWNDWLKIDASRPNDLAAAPLSRFMLVRLGDADWRFAWSVPDLVLDGWSWPVVFGEVSRFYSSFRSGECFQPHPARSYRDYVEWLDRRDTATDDEYWRNELRGLTASTPLPLSAAAGGPGRRFAEATTRLDSSRVEKLTAFCRRQRLTPGALVQGAWALLLARAAQTAKVVFGTAFSGRPAEFPGVQEIVGPFAANLPVVLAVDANASGAEFLRGVQEKLFSLAAHQYTSLVRLQDLSEMPWSSRLFESLVVFQNYQVEEALHRLGDDARISEFAGPIHTNYPLTLIVTPGTDWKVSLAYQEKACTPDWARMLLEDVIGLIERLAEHPEEAVGILSGGCRVQPGSAVAREMERRQPASRLAPRTVLEQQLASVWERAFGHSNFGVEDNFFDLGAQSLLLLRVHQKIREVTGKEISVVQLFQHPTIASLAAVLDPSAAAAGSVPPVAEQARMRAAAARAAQARARGVRPK